MHDGATGKLGRHQKEEWRRRRKEEKSSCDWCGRSMRYGHGDLCHDCDMLRGVAADLYKQLATHEREYIDAKNASKLYDIVRSESSYV